MEFNKAKHEVHLEKWRAIVYECRNSGTPVLAWLKEHGIPQGTYYRWQKEVWKSDKVQAALQEIYRQKDCEPQIAEITLPTFTEQNHQEMVKTYPPVSENHLELQQAQEKPVAVIRKGKMSCEIRNGIEPEILSQIVRLVNSCD